MSRLIKLSSIERARIQENVFALTRIAKGQKQNYAQRLSNIIRVKKLKTITSKNVNKIKAA